MADVVTIDKTDLLSLQRSLNILKNESKDAIRFATNDSMAALKTAASREIRERVTAKATFVNRTITIKKMFISDMTAYILCIGEPLPLIAYKYSQTVKGVKVQVKKPGTTSLIKHAFVATMKSGHKGIFWREGRYTGTSRRFPIGKKTVLPPPKKRTPAQIAMGFTTFQLPITERYGPRVPDVFARDDVMEPFLKEASDRYDDRLEYHTNRLIDKARAA